MSVHNLCICEHAGQHGKIGENVANCPTHIFRFVCADTISKRSDFTQTKILVCSERSIPPHTLKSVCTDLVFADKCEEMSECVWPHLLRQQTT
jgi:hypothetical protein